MQNLEELSDQLNEYRSKTKEKLKKVSPQPAYMFSTRHQILILTLQSFSQQKFLIYVKLM